jgi:hypothetical protein
MEEETRSHKDVEVAKGYKTDGVKVIGARKPSSSGTSVPEF